MPHPSVKELRTGLANAAAALDGISGSARARDSVSTPEVVVQPPEAIDYLSTFGGGAVYTIPVRVYAGKVDEKGAQDVLDRLISEDAPGSLKVALEADQTLGVGAEIVTVGSMRRYGVYTAGDTQYLGAELVVLVHA